MPATIYRPSIVIGDSTTGETQKYDGPYFILQLLIRQPRYAVLPVVGDPTVTRMNLVPRDFVIEAVDHLSSLAVSEGRTYQLADPAPLTIDELTDLLAEATDRKLVKIPLPRKLATTSVAHIPGLEHLLRIPPGVHRLLRAPHPLSDRPHPNRPGRHRHRTATSPRLRRSTRAVHARPPRHRLRGNELSARREPGGGLHDRVPGPSRGPRLSADRPCRAWP
jgi:hypothetical protein